MLTTINYHKKCIANKRNRLRIGLLGNPITCDCLMMDFIENYRSEIDSDTECFQPSKLKEKLVTELLRNETRCLLPDECPEKCMCSTQEFNKTLEIDCRNENLISFPLLNSIDPWLSMMKLNISNNSIEQLPSYELCPLCNLITHLLARNNSIASLNFSWPSNRLEVIDLSNNFLSNLSDIDHLLNRTQQSASILISGNRFQCDCDSIPSMQRILAQKSRILDYDQLLCINIGQHPNRITLSQLCKNHQTVLITISAWSLFVLVVLCACIEIYLRHETTIKIWLYSHNLCLSIVTEEELDRDRLYDAFIAYAHEDEQFVAENLLPVLESSPFNFRICIHVRDWIPGESILNQINHSIDSSRRTIVVLSKNMLRSTWGQLEFRTAHLNSLTERRVRVIVIILGDIASEQHLFDEDLQAYLKSNTYVQWGDAWFWKKLRYAMPHSVDTKGLKSSVTEFKLLRLNHDFNPYETKTCK
ncbi:protein toll-like [Uranotaenia lowii]|uniref:protein toll-like n=1 Tax=Uranotaenia lowii TaxID=190385 RepID=UPI00247A9553|nr:protein toll-like [Uranotaenia lowii]